MYVMLVCSLFLVCCFGQALIKHHLQLNKEHPIAKGPDAASMHINRYFQTIPESLMTGTFSCSEFADSRLSPLCRYIAVKSKGLEWGKKLMQGFNYEIDSELKECINKNIIFPSPMYFVAEECNALIYSNEDKMLSKLQAHIKKNSDAAHEDMDYLEGIKTLVKDLRPMPFLTKSIVFVGLLLSILILAACMFKFLFGGDYVLTVSSHREQ